MSVLWVCLLIVDGVRRGRRYDEYDDIIPRNDIVDPLQCLGWAEDGGGTGGGTGPGGGGNDGLGVDDVGIIFRFELLPLFLQLVLAHSTKGERVVIDGIDFGQGFGGEESTVYLEIMGGVIQEFVEVPAAQ